MTALWNDLAYLLAGGFIAWVIITIQIIKTTLEVAQGRIEYLERQLKESGTIK